MPIYFQRPENALKRAQEFIDVGKKSSALDALYDVIKSKKHRTWQKVHEPIMKLYLELCVELKKSHVAKEGLFQYRIICQQVNINSLEQVVKDYLALAEEKTEQARQESAQAVIDIDDLDLVQTPESLLMSAVSTEGNQERNDRVMLTPWVKFLWESYRQCLELLRNNSRVERLYHHIAMLAFNFCLKYSRKTEFRKLCDNLRTHLTHINRFQGTQTCVNLQSAETQQMQLETRICQLDVAISMELWLEAYKATEDIHNMMCLAKKSPKPSILAQYYQRLALVFLKAGNGLFHAAALHKHFNLFKELKKNTTEEELSALSTRVILATLATPLPPNRPEIDNLVETDENIIDKNNRVLANLLYSANPPTRQFLVKDLMRLGVVALAPQEIQKLFALLETEFDPLMLCSRVEECFGFIRSLTKEEEPKGEKDKISDMTVYLPGLKNMMVCRLLREIAQVYESISIKRVLELCPVINAFELEAAVVDAVRRNSLQVRIDHKKQALLFGSALTISQREETIEGPYLQAMPSDLIRTQLEKLYKVLHESVSIIQPESIAAERAERRKEILKLYNQVCSREHRKILERQDRIEKRKEDMENRSLAREEEERREEEKRQKKIREEEAARLAKEAKDREALRVQREEGERRKKMIMREIETLKKTDFGAKMIEGMEENDLEQMTSENIKQIQIEHWTREHKEQQSKMLKQRTKVDHMERAKRLEEIPLLEEEYTRQEEIRKNRWEAMEKDRVEKAIQDRTLAMEQKKRLSRMIEDKERFIEKIQAERYEEHKKRKEAFEKMLQEEKARRLEERREERKRERMEKWQAEKEEKARLALEAEKKRIEEEERALRNAQAEKQRQREEEALQKIKAERMKEAENERERVSNRRDEYQRPSQRNDDSANNNDRPLAWRRKAAGEDKGDESSFSSRERRGDDSSFMNRNRRPEDSSFSSNRDRRGNDSFGSNRDRRGDDSSFRGNRDQSAREPPRNTTTSDTNYNWRSRKA